MIPVIISADELSLPDAFTLPFTLLAKDYQGHETRCSLKYLIAIDPLNLFFCATGNVVALNHHPASVLGAFVEGLWNYDVVELFVCDDRSSKYREINLSITGAWWTAVFQRYRERTSDNCKIDDVTVIADRDKTSWRCGLQIPRSQLEVSCSWTENSRCNVSAILGREPRTFLSWASSTLSSPDFHRVECFESVAATPI